jgi:hypothetical protein
MLNLDQRRAPTEAVVHELGVTALCTYFFANGVTSHGHPVIAYAV